MADYYYPVLSSGGLKVRFDLGSIFADMENISISPVENWRKLERAVKIDEAALNTAITDTGITDAGLITFLRQLVTLPLKNRRDILTVLRKIKKSNAGDKEIIEQGHILMQQAFGVSSYEVGRGGMGGIISSPQSAEAVDLGRGYRGVLGSTYFLPAVTTDRKKFLIQRSGDSYKTYYDRIKPVPVSKVDYDDFFTQLETTSTDTVKLSVISSLKTMLKVATPGDLPDTKNLNAYMRFIFAPSAFEKAVVTRRGTPPRGTPPRATLDDPWGRTTKENVGIRNTGIRSVATRFAKFVGAHWLGFLVGAVALSAAVIGILALTTPASIIGIVGGLAAFGAKAALVPQLSILLTLLGIGTLVGLRASLFKTRRKRRRAEIKAWKKHKKLNNKLIKDKSIVNNRVIRLQNAVTPNASDMFTHKNVRKIKRALNKSEDNLEKMIKKLNKEKAERVKINSQSHLPGIKKDDALNTAQLVRLTTDKMKTTLGDNISKLEEVKKKLEDRRKLSKAAKVQEAIDKMKGLKTKTEHKQLEFYDSAHPETSDAIKVPGDIENEEKRRAGKRSS